MNGRVYDPLTTMFFSPNPFVQAPGNWLNFNRYAYCYGNPFKYTDPSGEVFGTIFGLISDLVDNIFVRTFNGEKWDWTQTQMGFKIDMGLFKTDPNKNGWGQAWELLSRFTWQLPQTLVGNLIVSTGNMFGKVNNVTYGYGVTAVDMGLDGGAITVGNYTAGPSGYTADWRDHLFVHEYGHYVQSQHWGPLYLFSVGIPSLQSAILQTSNPSSPRHHDRWFEADASYKAMSYFDKYYGSGKDGYTYRSPDYFDKNSFINRSYSPYINPRRGTTYQGGNHPISSKFHWTDILIYIPILGLIPAIFY